MERIVYFGDFNNRKQKELKSMAIERLHKNEGNKFYYLLPNGELLKKVRREFIDEVNATFELNVFTFDDIVGEILRRCEDREIGNPMKNIILRDVLKQLDEDGEINYYREQVEMEGFIHSLNDIIGQIKSSLVLPDEYLSKSKEDPKFREIGLIYREYEKILAENNFLDREGTYLKSLDLLREDKLLEDLEFIIIDEFYDFRPIEIAIIRELLKTDMNIYINIPFKSNSENTILNKTLNQLKDLDFKIEDIEKEEFGLYENFAKYVFSKEEMKFNSEGKVKKIIAPNRTLEMKRIFQEIKELNLQGIDLSDIGLVLTSPEYEEYVYKISKEEKIPISMNKKKSLREESLTRELLNVIENAMSRGEKIDLINRVKSIYFEMFDLLDKEKYELLLRMEDFSNLRELDNLVKSQQELNVSAENVEALIKINKVVESEIDKIPEKNTVVGYNEIIIKLLEEYKVEEKILSRFNSNLNQELLLRDMKTLEMIRESLESMDNSFFADKVIELEDYYFYLEQYFEEEEVVEFEGNSDGVHILNPINCRGLGKKIIFITGLYQGNYPVISKKGYFLNDYNLKDLLDTGIDMSSYIERIDNEELKFTSTIGQVKEMLYLSLNTGEDGNNIPSMFLDDLEGVIDDEIEEIKVDFKYRIKDELKEITSDREFLKFFINKSKEDGYFEEALLAINEDLNDDILDEILDMNLGEYYRENQVENEYSGLIKDDDIINDINANLGEKFSISSLENYSACPYFYLLNNILKVEETTRIFEEYKPIDIGIIYHEVLYDFYQKYRFEIKESIENKKDFDLNSKKSSLKDLVVKKSEERELDENISKDRLMISSIFERLLEFIEADLEYMTKNEIYPIEFERDFGRYKDFFVSEDGKKVLMQGRIDRIDKYIKEDKFTVMDYKSSSSGFNSMDELKSGVSLQLPVYILSQEREGRNVVASGYGIINDGQIDFKLGITEETKLMGRKRNGKLNRDEWNELTSLTERNIVDMVENIKSGKYIVKPLVCSNYCIYKDICRYEDLMEVEE